MAARKARNNGAADTIFTDLTARGGILGTDEVRDACRTLALKAGQYHTLQEDVCNGGTEAQKKRFYAKQITWDDIEKEQEDQRAQLEREINSAAMALTRNLRDRGPTNDLRVTVKYEGDPRGFTVKLVLPNGYQNAWGGGYGLTHNR